MTQIKNKTRPDNISLELIANLLAIKSLTSKISYLTGTVAHGGTIPLPAGYVEGECVWFVSLSNVDGSAIVGAFQRTECNASTRTSIVARQQVNNWVNGDTSTWVNGTANYIIIGIK